MRSPLRARLALFLLLALGAALSLAACGSGGGGGNDKDATGLIKEAFKHPIKSADLTMDMQVKLDGVQQLQQPILFKLSGPFQSNGKGRLPNLDFNASFSGGGQNISFGLTSTGDDFFVKVQGSAYEVGKQTISQVNQQLQQQASKNKGQGQSLGSLGIDPEAWLKGATKAGDEDVAGAKTTHVTSGLDVGKLLDDLNNAIAKAPTSGLGARKPQQLTGAQKNAVRDVVKDPHIDVYVSKDDNTLRRLSTDLKLSVPPDKQQQYGGLKGGTISFSIEFANVGSSKKVLAPQNAKPISELAGQLGGLGALGGAGGSGGATPGAGSGGSSSGSSGGAGAPSAQTFQKYSKCLKKAGSNDVAAIQKCSQILNGK